MKSFWISSTARSAFGLLLVLALISVSAGEAKKKAKKGRSAEELTNFLLAPERSQWLVGPIALMATEQQMATYLRFTDDEAAKQFIDDFWRDRPGAEPWPAPQPRDIFASRAEEADRLFSEGTRLGRRTDRGAIHVLYGPPAEITFEIDERGTRRGRSIGPERPPIEVWTYPEDAVEGLDGQRPKRKYYFVKKGDETVFNAGPPRRAIGRPD